MLSARGLTKPEPVLTPMLNPYDLGLNPCAEASVPTPAKWDYQYPSSLLHRMISHYKVI